MASERAIRIEADGVRVYAILSETPAAAAVWEALPFEGPAHRREGAVALAAPLMLSPETASRAAPGIGDVGYASDPAAIVFVLAPPPAAPGTGEPPPRIFARITGDATRLDRVRDGRIIRITRLEG